MIPEPKHIGATPKWACGLQIVAVLFYTSAFMTGALPVNQNPSSVLSLMNVEHCL